MAPQAKDAKPAQGKKLGKGKAAKITNANRQSGALTQDSAPSAASTSAEKLKSTNHSNNNNNLNQKTNPPNGQAAAIKVSNLLSLRTLALLPSSWTSAPPSSVVNKTVQR